MMDILKYIVIILVFSLKCKVAGGVLQTNEYRIVEKVLTGYDTNVRPVEDTSQPVVVKIGMALNQLIDLDERNQILAVKIWMRLRWTDDFMRWNASEYGGVNNIRLMAKDIWRPDITLYNDVGDPLDVERIYPADISADGSVVWNYPAVIKSTCYLDVTYFPWDQQKCDLKYGSWTFDGSKVDITNKTLSGDETYFIQSGEFELIGIPIVRHDVTYNCCPNTSFPDVTFWIVLRRKPLYYIFNLILPCLFITATTILVFYLPAEAGEKVSLGVTVLLALTVFLLLVAETMPPQSDSIPLIGQYFAATIFLLALSTALTVVILNLYHRGALGNDVPSWLRVLVLDWLATIMFLKTRVNQNLKSRNKKPRNNIVNSVTSISNGMSNKGFVVEEIDMNNGRKTPLAKERAFKENGSQVILEQILDVLVDFKDHNADKMRDEGCTTNWMLVAMVVDRFLLLVFFILTITVSLGILLNKPSYTDEEALIVE